VGERGDKGIVGRLYRRLWQNSPVVGYYRGIFLLNLTLMVWQKTPSSSFKLDDIGNRVQTTPAAYTVTQVWGCQGVYSPGDFFALKKIEAGKLVLVRCPMDYQASWRIDNLSSCIVLLFFIGIS